MDIEWNGVIQVATAILSLIGGVATVPAINYIKEKAGLSGRWAQILTVAVSILVATLLLVTNGAVSPPESITIDYILGVVSLVLVASQAEYQRLTKGEPE